MENRLFHNLWPNIWDGAGRPPSPEATDIALLNIARNYFLWILNIMIEGFILKIKKVTGNNVTDILYSGYIQMVKFHLNGFSLLLVGFIYLFI